MFRGWDLKELEGLSLSVDSKLMKQKWLLSNKSQRGWVWIITNLAASSLWHQLAVLNQYPPTKPSEKTSQTGTTDITMQSYTCQYMREGRGWCTKDKDIDFNTPGGSTAQALAWQTCLSTAEGDRWFRAPACLDVT